jgi:hypothetical protein
MIPQARQIETTLQVWLNKYSVCIGGTEQIAERSSLEDTEISFQKDIARRLVDGVQSGSSIDALRAFLQVSHSTNVTCDVGFASLSCF